MKSLLVSNSDAVGGAARACYRLHQALPLADVDSSMLVRRKVSADPAVEAIRGRGRSFAGSRISRLQHDDGEWTFRSYNVVPSLWSRAIASRNPDVVDLHWVGGETLSIADIGRIRAPVVHTLHDMWAFCGGEHYSSEALDARWRVGYRHDNRPATLHGFDLDRWTWGRKRRLWLSPRHVICPSRWLAQCVRSSALMGSWPVRVVPYALDMEVFKPMDRNECRRLLGLPSEATIVLFGADSSWADPRKGYDLFTAALDHLGRSETETIAVAFGQVEPLRTTTIPVRWVGYTKDDADLVRLYNAADVVVVPSRRDNLPQCGTEAQACGVPVVAFNTAGLEDVVQDGVTGILADPFSPISLAQSVRWIVDDPDRHAALSTAARTRAIQLWSPAVIAAQYREVYEEAVASRLNGAKKPA
jgi:glycosyltransferase involved in cell wall biosynthesis